MALLEITKDTRIIQKQNSIIWDNLKLNLSTNDKMALEYCKSCQYFERFYIIGLSCSKRNNLNNGEYLSAVLFNADGECECEYYDKKED